MRVALFTEGARPHPRRGTGDRCDRLVEGLPEHEFQRYPLTGPRTRDTAERLPPARRGRLGPAGRQRAQERFAVEPPAYAVAVLGRADSHR
ncbi:hypothetical protein ACFRMQ_32945 [Kitasatospora sp. NPDC056783]|uniref:hypothetical protein n=1 Tax=Kitasatospora sp. NPDC056783 TaxID=3345943 RepID=UPI0036AF006F